MAPILVAITALLLVLSALATAIGGPAAFADVQDLTVTVDSSLSLAGKPLLVTVAGELGQPLAGGKLVVSVQGPVTVGEVGLAEVTSGSTRSVTRTFESSSAELTEGGSAGNTTSGQATTGADELAEGRLLEKVSISAGALSKPGAYVVSAEVTIEKRSVASGLTWMGRVAGRAEPLDVSVIVPVSLGIHRDWTGVFYDQVLEKASLPVESGTETLRGLVGLVDRLPGSRWTLAVEPILLTQLRDMADGYAFVDGAGVRTEIDQNDLAAQNAAALISDLAGLADRDSVEIVASPYTGADLGLLAVEGWRDGLEQLQMGKQELQSTLGLDTTLSGAYAPDLKITGESLSSYAEASIDHVVVGSEVAGALAEPLAAGTVAVRAENADNERVTIVFAAEGVSSVMRSPWDTDVFSAALAAELAAVPHTALMIAPRDIFGAIPIEYLEGVAKILRSQDWIRVLTLGELSRTHSPDSRPVLLQDAGPQPQGYISTRIHEAVKEAHAPVSDLAAAVDDAKMTVDQAYLLLYMAESRWWSRAGVSPAEATRGLAYAREAQAAAVAELSKLRLVKMDSPLITSGDGVVRFTLENGADYAIEAELDLAGENISFPGGDRVPLDLQPGRTEILVEFAGEGGRQQIGAALVVGSTTLGELTRTLNRVGLWEVLPWVLVLVVLLVGSGAFLLARRRSRRNEDIVRE